MGINFRISTTYRWLPEDNLYRCTIELKIPTLAGGNMSLQDLILSNRVVMHERLHKFWGYFEDGCRVRVTHHDGENLQGLVSLVAEIKEELNDALRSIVRLNRYNGELRSTYNSTEGFTIE